MLLLVQSEFAVSSKNSLYTLVTMWQKSLCLPCVTTSQRKKPVETQLRMCSIELFIFA